MELKTPDCTKRTIRGFCAGLLDVAVVVAVDGGTDACFLTEQSGKMIGVLKSAGNGNGCDGFVGAAKQFLTVPKPNFQQVPVQCFSGILPKQLIEVITVISEMVGNRGIPGDGPVILLHIFLNFFHQRISVADMGLVMEYIQKGELQQCGA